MHRYVERIGVYNDEHRVEIIVQSFEPTVLPVQACNPQSVGYDLPQPHIINNYKKHASLVVTDWDNYYRNSASSYSDKGYRHSTFKTSVLLITYLRSIQLCCRC